MANEIQRKAVESVKSVLKLNSLKEYENESLSILLGRKNCIISQPIELYYFAANRNRKIGGISLISFSALPLPRCASVLAYLYFEYMSKRDLKKVYCIYLLHAIGYYVRKSLL